MAARVGTGVSGSGNAVPSVSTGAKNTTTGNFIIVFAKWEAGGNPVSSLTDTAGNTYTQVGSTITHTLGEPFCAMFYCANAIGNAANQFTINFTGSGNNFIIILAEEFSGIAASSPADGSPTTENTGNGSTFTTADITTTTPGLVIMGVGGFTALSSQSGTQGNPDFSIGVAGSDTFLAFLLSGSAQTVSPGATATGSDRWVAISQAFKDAGGGGNQALAGAAQAAGSAAADLAHGVPLAGGAAGAGTAAGALDHGVPLAGGATAAGSAAAQLQVPTLTLPALKNNAGTPLANEAGVTLYIYALTGALLATKSGRTTDTSGLLGAITDAALVSGTTYRCVIVLASGAEGMINVAAA